VTMETHSRGSTVRGSTVRMIAPRGLMKARGTKWQNSWTESDVKVWLDFNKETPSYKSTPPGKGR